MSQTPLHDDQKVEVPLSVCYLNVQSSRNKAILEADYVVAHCMYIVAHCMY